MAEASYQFGPISAGANSPLGALFGFGYDVSNNFATALANPYLTGAVAAADVAGALHGGPQIVKVPSGLQQGGILGAISEFISGTGATPEGIGGSVGGSVGTIVGVVGQTAGYGVGAAGAAAGQPLGAGVGAAASGVGTGFGQGAIAAGPGVGTGIGAALSGSFQGLGAALGNVLGGAGSVGSGDAFILAAGALVLLLLFLTL